ncbi:hypothetical protein HDU98_003112 [Podochytrium sp. JEL0797]|nr:hypothetical protein HDU98_003112 [Podochytrium sp. JEL0797]
MHTIRALSILAAIAASVSAQAATGPAPADLTVLNFALTLEHLESTYYQQGLAKFGTAAFASMGIPAAAANQFNVIAADEAIHVNALIATINANGRTGLPRTGVQAYDGGLHLIQANDVKNAAAAIATIEGRHSSFLNILTGLGPAPGPFETALGIRPVISIAAGLIKSCPYALPAIPFPALTTAGFGVTPQSAVQVMTFVPLNMAANLNTQGLQCNWAFGIQQARTPIVAAQMTGGGGVVPACQVPAAIQQAQFGQVVLFVVDQNRDVTLDDDKNVVAGPATVHIVNVNSNNMGMMGLARRGIVNRSARQVIVIKDGDASVNVNMNGPNTLVQSNASIVSVGIIAVIAFWSLLL